ncbi:MAG: hypothetical protein AAF465_16330 [Pseudomonadota bacterium]
MSWLPCVDSKPYPLAVPMVARALLVAVHGLVLAVLPFLDLPPEGIALSVIWVARSASATRRMLRRQQRGQIALDEKGRLRVTERPIFARARTPLGRQRNDSEAAVARTHNRSVKYENRRSWNSVGDARGDYTVSRSVEGPGCIAIKLRQEHGKHLEILVFYRYDQRQFYARLRRFLHVQRRLNTTHFVL